MRAANWIAFITLLLLGLALFGAFWTINQEQSIAAANATATSTAATSSQATGQPSSPLATFKELFLAAGAGIMALCSAYLGAYIQSSFQYQEKRRGERQRITNEYREYLEWLLKVGELADIVSKSPELRQSLPDNGKEYQITSQTIDQALKNMPLWWDYSSLQNKKTKEIVSKAISSALKNLENIRTGQPLILDEVEKNYHAAVKALEAYENN